jgi:AAA15 family ATPase/GTPase
MTVLILNHTAYLNRAKANFARKGVSALNVTFAERANEWCIRFVNIISARFLSFATLTLKVKKKVNRVRETERGWDALNENYNSPVHEPVDQSSL